MQGILLLIIFQPGGLDNSLGRGEIHAYLQLIITMAGNFHQCVALINKLY